MTEKRQTSQGYIIRILQHFATKLRNVTNFVMLFQAACDEIFLQACLDKILLIRGKLILSGYIIHDKPQRIILPILFPAIYS